MCRSGPERFYRGAMRDASAESCEIPRREPVPDARPAGDGGGNRWMRMAVQIHPQDDMASRIGGRPEYQGKTRLRHAESEAAPDSAPSCVNGCHRCSRGRYGLWKTPPVKYSRILQQRRTVDFRARGCVRVEDLPKCSIARDFHVFAPIRTTPWALNCAQRQQASVQSVIDRPAMCAPRRYRSRVVASIPASTFASSGTQSAPPAIPR